MAMSNDDFQLMSVFPLWGYLLVEGSKKFENRHTDLNPDKINKPVAMHATKKLGGSKQQRHGWYNLPVVQDTLSKKESTQDICDDVDALDDFFQRMTTCILGMRHVQKTVKVTATNREELMQKYSFSGVGCSIGDNVKVWGWIFHDVTRFASPICNVTGCRRS